MSVGDNNMRKENNADGDGFVASRTLRLCLVCHVPKYRGRKCVL